MNTFVIKQPVITEKTLWLASSANTYTFEVARTASKTQVQQAIEHLYKVEVTSVNTVLGHRSQKATGRKRIKRVQNSTKKALVTLKAGQNIALFDITGGQA